VNGDAIPLATSSVRARARPRAVIGVWAWETVLSLMGALPAVALVRAAYARHPRGDAPLWDAGALPLLGLLSREANGVRAATTTAAVALLLGATLGLVPMAALMVSISTATRDGRPIGGAQTAQRALRVLQPLGVLLVVVGLGQGVVVGSALLLGAGAQSLAHRSLGEALAQQLALALGAAVLLGALALGVTHDLARAAVVRFELGAMRALGVGARALRQAPFAVSWSWGWRTVSSAAPIVAVAWLADRIGGRGGVALVVLAALHQCVILARVALRASWLAKAIRTVDELSPADPLAATDEAIEADDHLGASDR
jgi:hypothetical protein